MFNCQVENCGKTVQSRQPVNKIVTKTRTKYYEKVHKRGKLKGTVETIKGSTL